MLDTLTYYAPPHFSSNSTCEISNIMHLQAEWEKCVPWSAGLWEASSSGINCPVSMQSRATTGPPAKRHWMAFRRRSDSDPLLYVYWKHILSQKAYGILAHFAHWLVMLLFWNVNIWFCYTKLSRDMWFQTKWHFDKCRLRRACAASS